VDGTRTSVIFDDCGNNYPLSNNMVGFSENSPIGLRSAHFSDVTSYQCLYNTDTIFYEIPSFTFSGWINFSSVREYGTILSISKPAYSGYPL